MTNYAKVGGILTIISGVFGFFWFAGALAIIPMMRLGIPRYGMPYGPETITMVVIFYLAAGIFYLCAGILAIIGGVTALKRRHWGWALAGAISGSLTFYPLGILSTIFTALARPEFEKAPEVSLAPPPPPVPPSSPPSP